MEVPIAEMSLRNIKRVHCNGFDVGHTSSFEAVAAGSYASAANAMRRHLDNAVVIATQPDADPDESEAIGV